MSRLYECPQCGRKVIRLQEVTAEDIQRMKSPPAAWQFVCPECFGKIRSVARLEPQYSLGRGVRDALVLVPTFSFLLVYGVVVVSIASGLGNRDVIRISIPLGGVTVFTGVGITWDILKDRYAGTHNLRWALNSRRVLVAISVIAAGIISSIISNYVLG